MPTILSPSYATFTDSEQRCIGAKIGKLSDEGKPRDQAIAIAIKTCAPSKARAEASALPREHRVTPETDGTYRVHQVPIFAAHTRSFPTGETLHVDLPWLLAAASRGNDRVAQDGYRAPVNGGVQLHAEENGRVAQMENYRIGRARYNGRETWVMFADLLTGDLEALQSQLAYRSVEILPEVVFGTAPPEVSALSMAESTVPWFRFPTAKLKGGYATTVTLSGHYGEPEYQGAIAWRAGVSDVAVLQRWPTFTYRMEAAEMPAIKKFSALSEKLTAAATAKGLDAAKLAEALSEMSGGAVDATTAQAFLDGTAEVPDEHIGHLAKILGLSEDELKSDAKGEPPAKVEASAGALGADYKKKSGNLSKGRFQRAARIAKVLIEGKGMPHGQAWAVAIRMARKEGAIESAAAEGFAMYEKMGDAVMDMDVDNDGSVDVDDLIEAIQELIKLIKGGMGAPETPAAVPAVKASVGPDPAVQYAADMAALRGELTRIKGRQDATDKAAAEAREIEAFRGRLQKTGRMHLWCAENETTARAMYQAGKLVEFEAALIRNVAPAEAVAGLGDVAEDPPEVAAYAASGRVEPARAAYASYHQQPDRVRERTSLGAFLEANVGRVKTNGTGRK